MKTQYTKHLILGGLINGKLYGPSTFTEIAEMDDLQSGSSDKAIFQDFLKQFCSLSNEQHVEKLFMISSLEYFYQNFSLTPNSLQRKQS